MWKDIQGFIGAVFEEWGILFFGAVFSAASWAIGKALVNVGMSDELPIRLLLALLVATALVACFRAWRAEHKSANAAGEKLASMTKAIFGFEIGEAMIGDGSHGLFLALNAAITNTGAPSVCLSYWLDVTPLTGEAFKASPIWVPPGGLDPAPNLHLPREDSLAVKTADAPIPTGGRHMGFLAYAAEGIKADKLKGAKLLLTCHDAYGGIHAFPITMNDERTDLRPMHGTNYAYTPPKDSEEKKNPQ